MLKLLTNYGVGFLLTLLVVSTAQANCVGPVVAGECLSGAEVNEYGEGSVNSNDSDNTYEYDLNSPADRGRYSIDLDAQRRDQLSTDIDRIRDEQQGRNGGGVYDDSRD